MCARSSPSSSDPAKGSEPGPESKLTPGLYLVATPIGNLGDISLRALDVLRAASLILCEDTRVSHKLAKTYGFPGKMVSCHEHNQRDRLPLIEASIARGEIVALISDAGMPLISDPGAPLVQEMQARQLPVTVIPGANAALTALSLSGLPSDRFFFAGFLPAKSAARRQELAALAQVPGTLIFYESPSRVNGLLVDLSQLMGERLLAVARELTKLHEEVRRGNAEDLMLHFTKFPPRGEVVVLVAPPEQIERWDADRIDSALREQLQTTSSRDAVAVVAALSGWPRREVYARAVALGQRKPS